MSCKRFPLAPAGGMEDKWVMSVISQTIMDELKEAMKSKNTVALNTLRALKSAFTNAAIEKGGLGTELDEGEELAIVRKQIKQRQDSIEQFEKADRAELAENEKKEVEVLEKYLPKALSEEEISGIVSAAVSELGASSRAEMGQVMKLVQEKAAGRADGKLLSQEVMKHLS